MVGAMLLVLQVAFVVALFGAALVGLGGAGTAGARVARVAGCMELAVVASYALVLTTADGYNDDGRSHWWHHPDERGNLSLALGVATLSAAVLLGTSWLGLTRPRSRVLLTGELALAAAAIAGLIVAAIRVYGGH